MKKIRTAILISGRGSNMANLVKYAQKNDSLAKIVLVISNKKNAKGLEFAAENGIKTCVIENRDFATREEFDAKIDEELRKNEIELVCLAGFMRLLSGEFTRKWEGKMINIHPSYLPDFKGGNAVRDALEAGASFSGCTVHFVCEEMDAGEIILQRKVEIMRGDDEESLAARILEVEHEIYPLAMEKVARTIANL